MSPISVHNYWLDTPSKWLTVGQKVRAIDYCIYPNMDGGFDLYAVPGDVGTVVMTDLGFWPVVLFDGTEQEADFSPLEIEPV